MSKITIDHTGRTVGRNARCPCGSGLKYKKCCGACGIAFFVVQVGPEDMSQSELEEHIDKGWSLVLRDPGGAPLRFPSYQGAVATTMASCPGRPYLVQAVTRDKVAAFERHFGKVKPSELNEV